LASSNLVEPPIVKNGAPAAGAPAVSTPAANLPANASVGRFIREALIVLSPPAAGVAALLIHQLVPNQQSSLPTDVYPKLLQILILATLALALVQWFWRPLRTWAQHYAPLLAGVFVWLTAWDLITLKLNWMPLPYFPGPDVVFQGMLDDRVILLDSTYHSLKLLLTGYLAGVAAGVVSGVLLGWFRLVRYWGMPALKLVGPVPATALIPLAMVLFANAFFSGAALIAWSVWFPVTMLTASGIANVPVSYLDVAKTLGASRIYLIFRVAIPSALPTIFVGVFMGLLVSFLTLCVAETVGVKNGLGYYVKWQQGYAEYGKVFGALVIMGLFFSGLLTLLFKVRDWVLVWQKGVIQW
jgi:NitT/TauT family transport system permease protein